MHTLGRAFTDSIKTYVHITSGAWTNSPQFFEEHARIQKVLSEGIQILTTFFFAVFLKLMRGTESSARQRNAINGVSQAGRLWPNIDCWFGSFVILQGIRTSNANKPYILVIFQGGGVRTPCPPLDPHMKKVNK